MRAFRSFDILITCHGSHLGNMLFAPHAVFVELQASYTHIQHALIAKQLIVLRIDYSDVPDDMPLPPIIVMACACMLASTFF